MSPTLGGAVILCGRNDFPRTGRLGVSLMVSYWLKLGMWPDWYLATLGLTLPTTDYLGFNKILVWMYARELAAIIWLRAAAGVDGALVVGGFCAAVNVLGVGSALERAQISPHRTLPESGDEADAKRHWRCNTALPARRVVLLAASHGGL